MAERIKKKLTTLTYKQYTIKPCECAVGHFDLYFTGKTNAIGYGYSFEDLLKRIITQELCENQDVKTLSDYVNGFKKGVLEIQSILTPEKVAIFGGRVPK